MKTSDLLQKIESGEISVDLCGHSVGVNENIIDKFLEVKSYSLEEIANNRESLEFLSLFLEKDLKIGDMLPRQLFYQEECGFCGKKISWTFDGNKVSLRHHFNEMNRKWEGQPDNFKCEYSNFKCFKGQINISSPLIIANYFSNIKSYPDGIKKWSYNNWAGRDSIAKYKCTQNVASGVVGNTSLNVYLNKDNNSIILKEDDNPIINFESLGYIILDAWRWEASDLNTIGKEEYKSIKDNGNFLKLDVPHGIWEFKHFYEFANNCNICSCFKLKS